MCYTFLEIKLIALSAVLIVCANLIYYGYFLTVDQPPMNCNYTIDFLIYLCGSIVYGTFYVQTTHLEIILFHGG
jgi:hypothetical protein